MTDYLARFGPVTARYPFQRWRKSGLAQYTEASCASFEQIFDRLIARLVAVGEQGSELDKLAAIRIAVEELNVLNERDESLIETGEREDLCSLVNVIAPACDLDPSKYGRGEGPASEWREW